MPNYRYPVSGIQPSKAAASQQILALEAGICGNRKVANDVEVLRVRNVLRQALTPRPRSGPFARRPLTGYFL
jgi:hypothetical protein